jgi:hypothetical protein
MVEPEALHLILLLVLAERLRVVAVLAMVVVDTIATLPGRLVVLLVGPEHMLVVAMEITREIHIHPVVAVVLEGLVVMRLPTTQEALAAKGLLPVSQEL